MSDIKMKAIREFQLEEELGKSLGLFMLEFTGWLHVLLHQSIQNDKSIGVVLERKRMPRT